MPSVSKAQQKFMGMVHAAQQGDMENPSPEVQKAADSMSDKDAKDFASTKHKGLPDHVKEFIIREVRGIKTISKEYGDIVDQIQKHLELYKQTKGTPAEKQHIQQLKQLNDKKKSLAAELDQKVSGMYKDAELKVDEINVTGNIDGYNTPYAFSGKDDETSKGKKQADLTGYSVVKESLIKEDIDTMYLAMIVMAQAAILGGNIGMLAGKYVDSKGVFPNIDDIKRWWKDRKDDKAVKSIIAKIKSDPEMIAFFKMSQTQQRGKFRKLVATKLSPDEIQYLNRINKSDLQENRWVALRQEESTPTQKIGRGISNINKQLKEMEQFLSWYGKIKNENGVSNKNFWKRTNSHIYNIKERLLKLDQQIRKISE